jgi:hypothetical protein
MYQNIDNREVLDAIMMSLTLESETHHNHTACCFCRCVDLSQKHSKERVCSLLQSSDHKSYEHIMTSSTNQAKQTDERQLGNGGYNGNAFNALPVSSLSWRYLGMFIDSNCNNKNRRLWNNYNYNTACRKVLWAAYYDPDYEGEGVAEYSYYQRSTGKWDTSTCEPETYGLYWTGTRCKRLDCHEAGTTLELLGVFKETDGLDDFTEQLFKHQGYCLWDGDKKGNGDDGHDNGNSDYEFMQNQRKNWVSGCTRLGTVDKKGNALYYDTKPLPGGDMTYGVYTDSSCTVESKLTWSNVLSSSYASYENKYNDGLPSISTLNRWNELLSDYKICQPCRAYNRIQTDVPDYGDGREEGGDGEGGKDPWGFNCYDDAGKMSYCIIMALAAWICLKTLLQFRLDRVPKLQSVLQIPNSDRYGTCIHSGFGTCYQARNNFRHCCEWNIVWKRTICSAEKWSSPC